MSKGYLYTPATCENCGERLQGDGYTNVLSCPNADTDGYEADSDPVYCVDEE